MREVNIYSGERLAGVLTEVTPSEYTFVYDDAYFADPSLPAISVTLGKGCRTHICDRLFPFFASLLPEGANRSVLCTRKRIDESDMFGMLAAMRGWDFIGDVSVR